MTAPGFKHDLYGSSHVWIHANADLNRSCMNWRTTDSSTSGRRTNYGHPDNGGPGIVIYRSIDKTVRSIAAYSEADARATGAVYDDFAAIRDGFIKAFFSPPAPPSLMTQALEKTRRACDACGNFLLSARRVGGAEFRRTILFGR